jgi:hypothetical protein
VARGSSKSSGSTRNRRENAETTVPVEDMPSPDAIEALTEQADSPEARTSTDEAPAAAAEVAEQDSPPATDADEAASPQPDGLAGDDSVTGAKDEVEDAEVVLEPGDGTETLATPEPEPTRPTPPPAPPPQRNSLVPMVIGGVVAAGIGFGAAYMGVLPSRGSAPDTAQTGAIAEALSTQSETLAALQAQVAELQTAPAATGVAGDIDLTPITDQIGALVEEIARVTETLGSLSDRVAVLEDRPVFSGDITTDNAAALEAATALEAELEAQRAAAAEQAATLQAAAEAAAQAAAEAEAQAAAAVAEAEAQAAAALARVEAEAALVQMQVALETGAPFGDAVAALGQVTEVPAGLSDLAASGVPTLGALQAEFPALARAALPRALQEAAGDSMGDRLGAFVMGQIGGRSVEPREGDDPDAVLSRIGAAIEAGDLDSALTELSALPEGAQAELASWATGVQARADALAGLAILSGALAPSGN